MTNRNTKASNNILEAIEYKLSDFILEFAELRQPEDNSRFGCENISDNLFRTYRDGRIYFKNIKTRCPSCNSRKVTFDSVKRRKLIFLRIGAQNCIIQQYKCDNCGYRFRTDLSSIVEKNSNVTIPVIEHILHLYSHFTGSIHKIQKSLKKEHNITISYQTIENRILMSEIELKFPDWSLSGYYELDALWVKKNGKWKYLLVLFDSKLNIVVARFLADSESTKTVYKFLQKSLRNQTVKCITTDLKHEYRDAIDKLNYKQQFCHFHVKQKINRDINDYIKENKLNTDEIKLINSYKKRIYDLLDSNSVNLAKKRRNKLMDEIESFPPVISKIMWDLIIPYFKKLTYHLLDENIESTNNKIENCFQKVFNKDTKKKYKTQKGIEKRFDMKANIWNEENGLI